MKIKNVVRAAMLTLLCSTAAFAQETLRVGDTVEYKCTCFGPFEWVKAKVEAVSGNKVRVRYGNGKYQADTVTNEPNTVRTPGGAARTAGANQLRDAFINDAGNKYGQTVRFFAQFYDAQYISGGYPTTAAGWQKAMTELAELDTLCKGKYAGVPNDLSHYLRPGIVDNRYAVWCEIAAKRSELEKPARTASAKSITSFSEIERELKESRDSREGFINGSVQMLIYDPAIWKQTATAKVQPRFAEVGATIPADYFADVERQGEEVKKLIDQAAPTRSFTQPAYQDAASQALAKREFAKMYPGIQVLKIGSDYATWKIFKNSLGIPTNQYKRGWALVKVPKRPFCQAKEWIVKQTYAGGGRFSATMSNFSSGPSGGIFMKCE